MEPEINIAGRRIGRAHPPLVIAEIGINHEGSIDKAIQLVDSAFAAGAECAKFQSHVIEDEMIPNDVVPGNTTETIWAIMERCALSEEEEIRVKRYVESKGMVFLSTPFSRAAADRLEQMEVPAYKIGSGECNNYPLVRHIASFGKPVILSTGMNDLTAIAPSVQILRDAGIPYALTHCTSIYPTPYDKVRLGALAQLTEAFPDAVIGLSDHSIGNFTCFAAVALGAAILEKHFTVDKTWPGPDVPISIDPVELRDLITGTRAVHSALGGGKTILPEEQPTIDFAYACVVTLADIAAGDVLTADNVWVKRPGTGEIKAVHYEALLGQRTTVGLPKNHQLRWSDVTGHSVSHDRSARDQGTVQREARK
jgi:N-acetylneuraminate synthase